MWFVADNHKNMCPVCAKEFWNSTLIKHLFKEYQILPKLPQISHIHKNQNFKSIIGIF